MEKIIQGIYEISDADKNALSKGNYVFRRCAETTNGVIKVCTLDMTTTEFFLTEAEPECHLYLTYNDRLFLSSTFEYEKFSKEE